MSLSFSFPSLFHVFVVCYCRRRSLTTMGGRSPNGKLIYGPAEAANRLPAHHIINNRAVVNGLPYTAVAKPSPFRESLAPEVSSAHSFTRPINIPTALHINTCVRGIVPNPAVKSIGGTWINRPLICAHNTIFGRCKRVNQFVKRLRIIWEFG